MAGQWPFLEKEDNLKIEGASSYVRCSHSVAGQILSESAGYSLDLPVTDQVRLGFLSLPPGSILSAMSSSALALPFASQGLITHNVACIVLPCRVCVFIIKNKPRREVKASLQLPCQP